MNEADALELMRQAMWTVLVVAGPAIGAAMVIGIIIALFQALTQIQEMTLTFVPKIVVVLAVLTIGASYIGNQIYVFTERAYSRIEKGY
jgi:flagellar biosynthetic protein FliQ